MNSANKYDEIVFSAGLSGIIYALYRKSAGMRVLLINHYGFPGGSITSAYNCFQALRMQEKEGIFNEFITSVKNEKHGFLYSDDSSIVINPEAAKMKLSGLLKDSGLDMLFHVNPVGIRVISDCEVELELSAKEGRIKVQGCSLLDASENHLIYKMHYKTAPDETLKRINLFITKPRNLHFADYKNLSQAARLLDGRYWLSLNVENAEAENAHSESIINDFNPYIMAAGSRIQLMPLEAFTCCKYNILKTIDAPVRTIEDLLGRSFLPDEQLVKAQEIENYLTGRQKNI